MTRKSRRRLAVGLLIVAATTLIAPILADLHHGSAGPADAEYLHPRLIAHPAIGVALTAVLLAGAAHLMLTHPAARALSRLIAGLVTMAALCAGAVSAAFLDAFEPEEKGTVAVSPDFTVMAYQVTGMFGPDGLTLRLRSRQGPVSRESGGDLACFLEPGYDLDPKWRFDQARFVGDAAVEVSAQDGSHWRIPFDTRTLSPLYSLDMCSAVPDEQLD
ncbi:MAG TPA: hypothetical protein VGD43_00615 [Micromonospora sp.]